MHEMVILLQKLKYEMVILELEFNLELGFNWYITRKLGAEPRKITYRKIK